MRIHQIEIKPPCRWLGQSKTIADTAAIPQGWVMCAIDPKPGQRWGGYGVGWQGLALDANAAAERLRAAIMTEVQSRLDEQARSWGYDDLRSAVSYIGDPFPQFAAEAVALRDWRSAVWVYAATASAATVEEFLAGLPPPPQRPATGLS